MTIPIDRHGSIRVEIRLGGHLDQHCSVWFGGLTLAHEVDGTTTLRGSLTDQAQLLGLRHPVKLLPLLLFEAGWKLLWLALSPRTLALGDRTGRLTPRG